MTDSAISFSSLELNQSVQRQAISDRKKKWRIRILSLLLKGDKKNKSIKAELVERKVSLAKNLVGNVVQGKDINGLFRLYDKLDQDIFVPAHVKYISSKFDPQVKIDGENHVIPLFDYLALLSSTRVSLADFFQNISLLKIAAQKQLDKNLPLKKSFNAPSTPYDAEQYYDEFKNILSPLYEKKYPEKILSNYTKNLYSEGKIDPSRVIEFLAMISHYPQKESLLSDVLEGVDRSQQLVVNGVTLSLADLIAIVRSLHISLHMFSPEQKK